MASTNDQASSATAAAEASTNATVLMDRFVSASSTQDVLDSLQGLVDGFKENENFDSNWILKDSPNVVEDLIHVIVTQKTPRDLPCEDGVALVCQLYLHGLSDNPLSLDVPTPGRMLEAMIDVMEDHSRPVYTRVLALQVLKRVSESHSSASQAQWLQAPNGMQRLADVLVPSAMDETNRNPMEEEMVRNEALLVALVLAKRHASISKFWLGFVELETKLLDLCWTEGGGLTKGTPIVLDCLGLIEAMLRHADASMQDLVWQRPTVAPRLAQLLDLRGGTQFLHPEELAKAAATVNAVSEDSNKKSKSEHATIDDLDDLLQSGETKKDDAKAPRAEAEADNEGPTVPIPRLTNSEEQVVQRVLHILQLLLQSEQLRTTVWKQHAGLCSLIWELALVSPAVPPVCALPSPALQQSALEVVACNFNDPDIMDRLGGGMDRVLYLVCTGGGVGTKSFSRTVQEQLGISQAALHVLRRTLNGEMIQQLLLHTLAPPLDENEDSFREPVGPTVIQKLWNTVVDFLVPPQRDDSESAKSYDTKRNQRRVFLSGALSGLGIFLHDDTCREMMSKLTPPHLANLDQLLETLQDNNGDTSDPDTDVQWAVLRFLCEWVVDTPLMVHTLLSSNESTHLAAIAATGDRTGIGAITTSLVHLLLGLAMEHMGEGIAEEKCGGWTRAGILQIITKVGIGKYTSSLERFKKLSIEEAQAHHLPWAASNLEFKHFKEWYGKAVWVVRKRVVEELTGGSGGDDDDDDETDVSTSKGPQEGMTPADAMALNTSASAPINAGMVPGTTVPSPSSSSGSGLKPLQRLIAQQTREIEELRQNIATSEAKVQSQQRQLDNWNRRVESTPTQLDSMLNEFTAKNGRLEEQIAALQKELNDAKAQHTEDLRNRDDKIRQQMEESRDLQGQVAEAREDRDRMEQELQALSQAYTSLEEEFQRQQQQGREIGTQSTTDNTSETVAGGAETGETSEQSEQRQPQGEVSQQAPTLPTPNASMVTGGTSTEVATLRSENNRLRNDARAADEWMSMAVQRMNEMAAHNGNLERQVASLTNQLTAAGTTSQQQQPGAVTTDTSLLTHDEQHQAELLRQQLQESVHQEQELRERVESLSLQLREEQELRQGSAVGVSIREELEGEREAKRQLEVQLSNSKEETRIAVDSLSKIKDERDQLDQNLEVLKTELERSRPSESGDSRVKEEEIAELQAANEAAQEWMSQAVAHHQLLSAQVASLTQEKAALELQLKEGPGKEAVSGASVPSVKLLEETLSVRTEELQAAKSDLKQQEEELQSLHRKLEANKSVQEELVIVQNELDILRQNGQTSSNMSEQIAGDSSGSGVSSQEEKEALRIENDALKSTSEELQQKLEEFQVWADTAQQRIADILAAKVQVENQLKNANDSLDQSARDNSDLRAQLEAVSAKKTAKEGDEKDALHHADGIKAASENPATECAGEDNELANLQIRYKELQDWVDAAQARMSELFSAKESAENLLTKANETLESREQEVDSIRAELAEFKIKENRMDEVQEAGSETISELQAQLKAKDDAFLNLKASISQDERDTQQWNERVSELELNLQDVKRQLDQKEQEANIVIEKWQDICNNHEERCMRLEQELEIAKKEKDALAGVKRHTEEDKLVGHESSPEASSAAEFFAGGESDVRLAPQRTELETQLQEKEIALGEVKEGAAIGVEESAQEWEERVADLESTVQGLKDQLEQREQDAKSEIDILQEACGASDARCAQLEQELKSVKEECRQQPTKDRNEGIEPASQSLSAHDFFSSVGNEPANEPVSDRITALEAQLKESETALKEAREILARDEDVVQQWEERVADLESTVKGLEIQLEEQEQEATTVIEKWQESCSATEERCADLEKELQTLKARETWEGLGRSRDVDAQTDVVSEVKSQTALDFFSSEEHEPQNIENLESKLREKEEALQEAQASLKRDEAVVTQWEDRVVELEATVKRLELQLEEQEEDANNVIDKWQESCAALDEKCSELERQLEGFRKDNETVKHSDNDGDVAVTPNSADREQRTMSEARFGEEEPAQRIEELEAQLREKEQSLKQLQETLVSDEAVVQQWEDRAAELEAAATDLRRQLEEQESEANVVISQWQESCAAAEESSLQYKKELDSLSSQNEILSKKVAGTEADSSMLEIEKASLEDQISSLEKLLSASREEASALEQNRSQGAEELAGRFREKEEALREAQASIEGSDNVIRQLKERLFELESRLEEKVQDALASSEQKRRQLEKEIDENTKAYGVAKEECQQVQEENASLKEQVRTLETELIEARQTGNDNYPGQQNEPVQNHQVNEAESLLPEAKEGLAREENTSREWEERVAGLQMDVKDLEARLADQQQEADNTISGLKNSRAELEAENADLIQKLSLTEATVAGAREAMERDSHDKFDEISGKLEVAEKKLSQSEESRKKLEEDSSITIATLQEDLESKKKQALELESKLEESRSSMSDNLLLRNELVECQAKLARITEVNDEKLLAQQTEHQKLLADLQEDRLALSEARDEASSLRQELAEVRNESEDVVNQWTERYSELEAVVKELEEQLDQQMNEANEAISSWESRCTEYEAKLDEMEAELNAATELLNQVDLQVPDGKEPSLLAILDVLLSERQSATQDRGSLHAQLDAQSEKEEHLEKQIESLKANLNYLMETSDRVETELDQERQSRCELQEEVDRLDDCYKEIVESKNNLRKESEQRMRELQVERNALEEELNDSKKQLEAGKQELRKAVEDLEAKGREQLEKERDRLTIVIGQLQEELRGANEIVQVYVTDGASDKATEVVAQTLRGEIEDMRLQLARDREVLVSERAARDDAEQEVKRLTADIAALISLSDNEFSMDETNMLSIKATEKLSKKERAEIEQIRKSLHRALDELDHARTAEKDAIEKLSKVRLQASVCEQDLVAAKSELNFMAQTMDEMRAAEASNRASLEYRIGSLENDNDVLRRYHAGEIESLRSDLEQVTMEKDRILHSLKESEKRNASLLLASKAESEDGSEYVDIESEAARLRVENAHLLTIAGDAKARAERRLRETLGAQASSAEADAILERELRIAAEAAVQTMKVELEDLRANIPDERDSLDKRTINTASVDTLKSQLEALTEEAQSLKQSNAELKSKMEVSAAQAKSDIATLTEECRKAQAKLHKLEREGRFEAAVKTEVSRIHMSPGISTFEKTDGGDNEWLVVGQNVESNIMGAGAYDYILKQKESIKEERAMYIELLSEHDSLLALLAQRDEEKSCLSSALKDATGQEGVDAAIKEAERNSLTSYGNFLRG